MRSEFRREIVEQTTGHVVRALAASLSGYDCLGDAASVRVSVTKLRPVTVHGLHRHWRHAYTMCVNSGGDDDDDDG